MKLRRVSVLVSSVLLCFVLAPAAFAGGEISLFLGQKSLSEDDAESLEVDGQTQFGLISSWDFEWPVALAVDVLNSSDDASSENSYTYAYGGGRGIPPVTYTYEYEADISTTELNVGVRKFWGDKLRFYVGGGLAAILMDVDLVLTDVTVDAPVRGVVFPVTVVDDSDTGIGFFTNAGLQWIQGFS